MANAGIKIRINGYLIRRLKTQTGHLAHTYAIIAALLAGYGARYIREGEIVVAVLFIAIGLGHVGLAIVEFREWRRLRTTVEYIERRDRRDG